MKEGTKVVDEHLGYKTLKTLVRRRARVERMRWLSCIGGTKEPRGEMLKGVSQEQKQILRN